MVSASTPKFYFLLHVLALGLFAFVFSGCETQETTTVSDGFGMSFQEQSSDDNDNSDNGVKISK